MHTHTSTQTEPNYIHAKKDESSLEVNLAILRVVIRGILNDAERIK